MAELPTIDDMPAALSGALSDGYRSILEGVGDARKADNIYGYLLPMVYRDIFSRESLNALYRLVSSREGQYAVVSRRPELKARDTGAPLEVRFTRNNVHPQFIETMNVITVPIMPYMAHSMFRLVNGDTRDKPQYLDPVMPFEEMCRQLAKSWKENTPGSYDTVCLRDTLLHELTHWYDFNLRRDAIIRPAAERKRPVYRDKASAEFGEWKDAHFRPYRGARFSGDDANALANAPEWVTPEVMERVKSIEAAKAHAEALKNTGRPYVNIPEEDEEYLEWFNKMCNRHNAKGYHANAGELSARIVEQVPWLIELKEQADRKGETIPLRPTLEKMLDRVFDISPDGPGFMHDRHEVTKSLVLPGALRSAARRCCKLINAANDAFMPEGASHMDKVRQILLYLQKEAKPEHAERQL